jgi:hypothetical protein
MSIRIAQNNWARYNDAINNHVLGVFIVFFLKVDPEEGSSKFLKDNDNFPLSNPCGTYKIQH